MNPLSALILIIVGAFIFSRSRVGALLALMACVLYLPQSQGIDFFGINLFPTRLIGVLLFLRVLARRELAQIKINAIDKAFVALYSFATVVFLLRSSEEQVFEIGKTLDACLIYFSCRALIDTPENFRVFLRSLAVLLIPFTLIVLLERLQGENPFSFMGWGVNADTWVRGDKVRCFGSFRHPSLLGTVGIAFIPLYVGMLFSPADRNRGLLGIFLGLIIVWTTNSGGPISGVAFGGVAWMCWRLRMKMRSVRWGIVGVLSAAAVLMKAPVWYLIARVSSVTGGDGWHRSYLMEVSFRNIGQWWLAGMPISGTADWFPYVLAATHGADITNQFISFGLTAGLGAMALFIFLLVRCFSALGKALNATRQESLEPTASEYFMWGFCCMLAAHIVNWLGITYFDQSYVIWFLELGAIASVSNWYIEKSSETLIETGEHQEALQSRDATQVPAQ